MMFDPVMRKAGEIADTSFYQARPATHLLNGASGSSQVVTLGGTVNLNPQPYQIEYTRVYDGYKWQATGILYLTRQQQTLPLATRALATSLNNYQDVIATVNGANLTLVGKDKSVTAELSMLSSSTITLATSTVTAAQAPKPMMPGDIVAFSVDPISGEKVLAPVGSVDVLAANFGVIIRPLFTIDPMRAENVTYDILTMGTIWMKLYGTAPIVPATTAIQIGNFDSTTPGKIAIAGSTATKFTVQNLMAANGTLSKFAILDKNVAVGQHFRLELR